MRVRRRRMERRPQRQRHLSKPVISVGNLSMGGTGKTPVVSAIAEWLIDAGHRPSILTRGYGREDAVDGIVVIDPATPIESGRRRTDDAGAPGARRDRVRISDRYLGGVLAEKLGCTVHLLDDGFQHIDLARELDILVTTVGEIPNGRLIPFGRLREPSDAAARAHFLVVTDATAGAASAEAWALGISQSCGSLRRLAEPVGIREPGAGTPASPKFLPSPESLIPDRFVQSLREAGWNVVDAMTFPDHHRYSAKDVAAIASRMEASGATAVFTTDKDAVRFEAMVPSFPLYRVPLVVEFDPPDALFESVKAVVG